MEPVRLQLSRKAGSKLTSPNGLPVVKVDRTTKWGNPITLENLSIILVGKNPEGQQAFSSRPPTARDVLKAYRRAIWDRDYGYGLFEIGQELAGVNLACWCKLCPKHKNGRPLRTKCADCAPCHADLLLKFANRKSNIRDITGQSFGKLTAIRPVGTAKRACGGIAIWEFKCECGRVIRKRSSGIARLRGRLSCGQCDNLEHFHRGQAKRVGVPFDEYMKHVDKGLKFCVYHQRWEPLDHFTPDRWRSDGHKNSCRPAMRTLAKLKKRSLTKSEREARAKYYRDYRALRTKLRKAAKAAKAKKG